MASLSAVGVALPLHLKVPAGSTVGLACRRTFPQQHLQPQQQRQVLSERHGCLWEWGGLSSFRLSSSSSSLSEALLESHSVQIGATLESTECRIGQKSRVGIASSPSSLARRGSLFQGQPCLSWEGGRGRGRAVGIPRCLAQSSEEQVEHDTQPVQQLQTQDVEEQQQQPQQEAQPLEEHRQQQEEHQEQEQPQQPIQQQQIEQQQDLEPTGQQHQEQAQQQEEEQQKPEQPQQAVEQQQIEKEQDLQQTVQQHQEQELLQQEEEQQQQEVQQPKQQQAEKQQPDQQQEEQQQSQRQQPEPRFVDPSTATAGLEKIARFIQLIQSLEKRTADIETRHQWDVAEVTVLTQMVQQFEGRIQGLESKHEAALQAYEKRFVDLQSECEQEVGRLTARVDELLQQLPAEGATSTSSSSA
eukprot:TRINITY_DN185_c0_g1_i1.p1 TRINITY_DN185_c0_g1~~TRINITY_DN185_c0_g1_i1.p1  ORF type:complete len:414 (-),score=168.71 TRINITY_DN185_c0_g1_i1:1172-2413(-)